MHLSPPSIVPNMFIDGLLEFAARSLDAFVCLATNACAFENDTPRRESQAHSSTMLSGKLAQTHEPQIAIVITRQDAVEWPDWNRETW
jgi:hypothetical protein